MILLKRAQRSMQLTIKSWLLFIGNLIARSITWMQTRPEKQELRRSNLYRGCSNLPMENFIQCLCEEDYAYLVIEGEATDRELHEAWVLILAEYYELRGDTSEGMEVWQLSRDIMRIQNHLFLLEQCVEFLKEKWSDSIAESVNKLGYPFKPASKEDYTEELNRVVNKAKTKYIQLRQNIKLLEEKVSKLGDKKPTRDYFDNMLIHIEEMQKVSYSMDTLPVQKFVLLEKKYWNQVEQLKARAAKNGHRAH